MKQPSTLSRCGRLLALLMLLSFNSVAQNANPFAGFRFLSLARDYVPIGAIWNSDLGPMGNGVNKSQVTTAKSYSNLSLYLNNDQKNGLEVSIMDFLQLGGKYSSLSDVNVKLKKISIATLNSMDVIKSNVGNLLLYEAVKAEQIEITVSKEHSVDAQMDLLNILKPVDVSATNESGNKVRLTLNGVNLYLAYRVIKIQAGKSDVTRLKFSSQGHSSDSKVVLSSRYEAQTPDFTVQICPCSIQNCIRNYQNDQHSADERFNRCAADIGFDLTVILKNSIDMNSGKPQEHSYVVKSPNGGSIFNYNQSIYNKSTSNGLEVFYLNIERLIYEVIGNTSMVYMLSEKKNRNVSLVKANFTFSNIVPKAIPGW